MLTQQVFLGHIYNDFLLWWRCSHKLFMKECHKRFMEND